MGIFGAVPLIFPKFLGGLHTKTPTYMDVRNLRKMRKCRGLLRAVSLRRTQSSPSAETENLNHMNRAGITRSHEITASVIEITEKLVSTSRLISQLNYLFLDEPPMTGHRKKLIQARHNLEKAIKLLGDCDPQG
jgi:hypothetical protein